MLPKIYSNTYTSVKYFLSSYRALVDGHQGINQLRLMLKSENLLTYEWKIAWIGTCTTIRSSIDLFKIDIKSCINEKIKHELKTEWVSIDKNRDDHAIFWDFLRKERDLIIHEYKWNAYVEWLDKSGNISKTKPTILGYDGTKYTPILIMKSGRYEGRNSLSLLEESAHWAEERILSAIVRAGFDPDEERNIVTFEPRPPLIDKCEPSKN